MSVGLPRRFILALEGPSDERRVHALVDHLLKKRGDHTMPLEEQRRFEGIEGNSYIKITKIPELARARGLNARYSPDGPKKGDGGTLRILWQVLTKDRLLGPDVVVIWVRDDDGHPERRSEAVACRESLDAMSIRIGIASECGEAWVIAGFRPETSTAKVKAAEWRKKLGFAPHEEPHRLSHKVGVPKSAKEVHDDLFESDQEQQMQALLDAADARNGASKICGLTAFCEEIDNYLSPPEE